MSAPWFERWAADDHDWWRVRLYHWFPFDAHFDVLKVRFRVCIGHFYTMVKVEAVVYSTHAHLHIQPWFCLIDISAFWPRFWRAPQPRAGSKSTGIAE